MLLVFAPALVSAGCGDRDSDKAPSHTRRGSDKASSYTRADVQRTFETQGIKLVPVELGGQQYLLQDGYRDAIGVWVRPPGSPDEFGIKLREGIDT